MPNRSDKGPLVPVPRYMGHLDKPKKYVCKHCKVEVRSQTDFFPVLGHEHKKACPRRYRYPA